ncbi:MAG TPA: DUF5715 family protein [Pyrinomonadaceae bacterium]
MKSKRTNLIFLSWISVLIIAFAISLIAPRWKQHGNLSSLLPVVVRPPAVNSWMAAAERVKEDRGEPVGKQAVVETPSQLRHYSDTRRFLATQVAEVVEQRIDTAEDFVDLASSINQNELVQLQPVTDNYILFGVGGSADSEPFSRYEKGKSLALYNEAGLQQQYSRLAESEASLSSQLAGLKQELRNVKRRERSRRAALQAQINAAEKALQLNRENKATLDSAYGKQASRQQLFAANETLAQLGRKLEGNAFDIADGAARRQLKIRMLSSLRPAALNVLNEIAASYHEKFNRQLPVTSLVRPDEYQHELSKTNPNATRIETPPHSTGLAFDILYRYMTAAEQAHVMAELARLKDEGRIEVLRENRDHYHVFAFVDGARPDEKFVAAALGGIRSGKTAEPRTATARSEAHHASKKTVKKQKINSVKARPATKRKRR